MTIFPIFATKKITQKEPKYRKIHFYIFLLSSVFCVLPNQKKYDSLSTLKIILLYRNCTCSHLKISIHISANPEQDFKRLLLLKQMSRYGLMKKTSSFEICSVPELFLFIGRMFPSQKPYWLQRGLLLPAYCVLLICL
jgi:hypothetical protein